jgi:hypothetical protein
MVHRGISSYAAILIHADIDLVWRYTQDPALQTQWDLRLSSLRYLPRPDRREPQRFVFGTLLGLEGEGEIVGMCSDDAGVRTVQLRYGLATHEAWAIWQYVPVDEGVWLLTRVGFRSPLRGLLEPVMTWTTARSLERLRRLVERANSP